MLINRKNKKKALACLLVALLILPTAIKTAHQVSCHKHELMGQAHHNCNDCPVCHFIFSLFTESDIYIITEIPPNVLSEVFIRENKLTARVKFSYQLRAPPAEFLNT